MKQFTLLISASIFSIVLSINTAFAQTQASPIYTITSQSLLENHCVDAPPFGDGFGWNGFCTCATAGIAYEWSTITALVRNQLIATSSNTPGQCLESGSVSIYDWRGNQPPIKLQELVSSMPGSRFGHTAEPLGTFRPIGLSGGGNTLAINDQFIAVRSSGSEDFITVFKRNGERWEEDVILQEVRQDRGDFGSQMVFLDEQSFLVNESDVLVIYNTSDWSIAQEFELSGGLEPAGDGFVLSRNNGSNKEVDYFVKEGGAFVKKQTFSGGFSSISGNYMIFEVLGPLALQRQLTIVTRELTTSGQWVDMPNATLEFENERLIESVHLVGDQLVLSIADGIHIYSLSDAKSWNLTQQINIDSIAECDSWCDPSGFSVKTDDGRIIANNFALVSHGVTAHTIYERSDSGEWVEKQTITAPQSSFFTPHFSLIDDFAFVELTASTELPASSDRSTVAVFSLDQQPAIEETDSADGGNQTGSMQAVDTNGTEDTLNENSGDTIPGAETDAPADTSIDMEGSSGSDEPTDANSDSSVDGAPELDNSENSASGGGGTISLSLLMLMVLLCNLFQWGRYKLIKDISRSVAG